MQFDFDKPVDRSTSHSLKFDARKAVFGTEDVLPLWVADMDFAAPEAVTEALVTRAQHPIYGYTLFPDSIYQSMVEWCQRRYDWTIEQNQVVMCPGVVPSLHAVIEALTQVGDKVVIQPPVYPPFFTAVTETGRELMLNPLKLVNQHYQFDLEQLEQCAKQGAKLLILCSPHNPVGRVWTEQELTKLLAITDKYQMMVLSDEIHADLLYPGQRHVPLAKLSEKGNVVTAIAPSKTFNIPGLGLSSLVVTDKEQRKAIKKVFDSWHVIPTNPFSLTAFEAAYRYGEPWLEALISYLDETRQWVSDFTEQYLPKMTLIPSEGTYLLWFDCREMGLDDASLKQFFVEKAKVGMNPGSTFGEAGSGFMRMNIGTNRAQVKQALQQILVAFQEMS